MDYPMEQTMRWFGPADPVSLADIRQAGCEGVVTALHHIPNGVEWPIAEIAARKRLIEEAGMHWTVVESVPVHEAIKRGEPGASAYVEAYKATLRNLAACGIEVVTYNFMPVLDWTRTDLAFAMPDGALALRFEWDAVAAYDIHVLNRPGAERDYAPEVRARAAQRYAAMDEAERTRLERTIIAGLPGSEEHFGAAEFLAAIDAYQGMSPDDLRGNLIAFLREVAPVAQEVGIRLALHPDDPPAPIFGLPRCVSTADDLAAILAAVDLPANGLCLCVGSLAAGAHNDILAIVRRFGPRTHFLHLRNIARDAQGDFHESAHLDGIIDMPAVVAEIIDLSQREHRRIPMRPDHGHQMLDDLKKRTNPGYSAIGRLRGLAELRGLEMGLGRQALT